MERDFVQIFENDENKTIRDGSQYQDGWILGKLSNKRPLTPPSFSENPPPNRLNLNNTFQM